jgi:hypothetical protein
MTDFFQHFRNRFETNPELCTLENPKLEHTLEHSFEEITNFEIWKNAPACLQMLSWLREQVQNEQSVRSNSHESLDFFAANQAKGVRIHPALTQFADKHFAHFFNFLKEQFIAQGFKSTLSDTRIFGRGVWDETIHRHILKPRNENNSPFAQITIELMLKDDHLTNLKIEATLQNQEKPHSTHDFSELMQSVLV